MMVAHRLVSKDYEALASHGTKAPQSSSGPPTANSCGHIHSHKEPKVTYSDSQCSICALIVFELKPSMRVHDAFSWARPWEDVWSAGRPLLEITIG